jgi:uroporphyrin-3 C-methyltransferase
MPNKPHSSHKINTPTETSNNPSSKFCCRKGLPILALILAIISLIMAAINAHCLKRVIHVIKADQEQQTLLVKGITEMQNTVRLQQTELDKALKRINVSQLTLAYQETAYLAKQSVYQLKLDNIEAASMLLQSAATRLEGISAPTSRSVKEKLTGILQLLKAREKIDRTVIMQQLEQLNQQVDALPLKTPSASGAKAPSTPSTSETGIWQNLRESWHFLGQLIIVRHHEQPVEPLLSVDQTFYLKQNLQLRLGEASLAVLYRDQGLYRTSMQIAKTWVKQFFNLNAKNTQAFINHIDNLLQMDVSIATPNVFTTLDSILRELNEQIDSVNKTSLALGSVKQGAEKKKA